MMTHKRWQDMLPFYAAGTLARPDMIALERHLAGCRACRTALEEWRSVAGIVRVEADAWARSAPPLSPEVRAHFQVGVTTSSNGYHNDLPVWSLEQTLYRQKPVGAHSGARRFHLPITLGAATVAILAFGFLLLTIISRDKPPSPLSQPGFSPTLSPTETLVPSGTRFPGPAVIPPSAVPVSIEPQDLGILPAIPLTPTIASLIVPLTPTLVTTWSVYMPPNAVATAAASPPPNRCTGEVAPGDMVTLYRGPDRASGTSFVLYPGMLFQVIARSDEGWYQVVAPILMILNSDGSYQTVTPNGAVTGYGVVTGWVQGDRVMLHGPCSTLPMATPETPTSTPVPTLIYGESIGMGYMMITTEPIGDMPAGTRVRISHAQFDGSQWRYYVVAEDEQRTAWATASQLTYAPNVTPGPTPTAQFGSSIGMGYLFITTESVGPIPAGARVGIGSAWFDGTDWIYSIVAADGHATAEARQSQLVYAPNVTPGPTPTAQFGSSIGMGYLFITTAPVGSIPAGARVRIGSAWFDGIAWVYTIVTEDGRTTADARESQLAYVLPATPTPTPSFTLTGGSS